MGVKGDRAIWEAESRDVELVYTTVGDILDRQAETRPEKEALVYNYPEIGLNLRLNFRQYRDEANRVAKGMLALGIQKGEHIAIWAANLPQWIFVQLAAAKIGAVLTTINTAFRSPEVEYVLRQGDVTTLFMVEEVRGNSYLETLYNLTPEIKQISDPAHETLHSPNLPKLRRAVLIGETSQPGLLPFSELLTLGQSVSDADLKERQASVKPDDVIILMYTSGTTGFPKGAMLTHHNLTFMGQYGAGGRDWSDERIVNPMPLFHIAGCACVLIGVRTGATLVQMIAFDPVKQLELLSSEKGTWSFSVPTMLIAMLNNPRFLAGEFDLSSLKIIASGGAAVPITLMEQVKAKMGAEAAIAFGQTESSAVISGTVETDSFELRSGTVGVAAPHMEVKIVNLHSGEVVGFGETGELLTRGPSVMKGYYNMSEKTAEAIDAEGWLHSGDLATMNEQGYLNIVGRVKEMIIRGGENIYPAEIEQFLMGHSKIAEAQVIGVPDSFMGEEMVALLRLRPGESATEEELREYCRANISRHKQPKYIKFVIEYPMTTSGKVKKFELKTRLLKELGLEEVAKTKTA